MTRILRRSTSHQLHALLLLLLTTGLSLWSLGAQATDWPQEITAPEGTIVIYQPQPESLNGNVLTGRAAMSFESAGNKKTPVFGAFWFSAKIDTDTDNDSATIRDVRVTKVRWPDVTDAKAERFTKIVEGAIPTAGYEISMARLSASLASAIREQKSLADLKNDPPKIIFSEQLAVLLIYDGAPRFFPVENSDYERVLNTPYAVARNTKTKLVYLSSGTWWYVAQDPLGPWKPLMVPPEDLVKMLPAADKHTQAQTRMPAIVVATEPTELIVSDGKPEWTSLTGGQLLYVKNTETPWLREVASGDMYVLLSGRWFRASGADGPWTFVRPDRLPASFKDIPPDSDIGGVRVSVAGTDEADNAVLDAQIPQTAAIKRKEARLEVKYDGEPRFEKISGTSVSYAINTATQVLEIDGRYYAVDNGVWFTSAKALGPWLVADKIPEEEIQKIPPSAPVYNVTYVHIYETTPEVVYVGYTPGYLWSYPYYGVPVYGTGWYYPPYWGTIYYPRPPTWGMHVGYNPWTGWNMGLSWSNGFVTVGIGWSGGYGHYPPSHCCGGFYGGGYHPQPVRINTGDINIGNSVGGGNRNQVNPNIKNNGKNNIQNNPGKNNIYNRAENKTRVADRSGAQAGTKQARAASGRENNVYADRNGNIAQRSGDQWQTRDQGSWKPDQTRQTAQDRNDMNSAYKSRQSGASREMSRPAAPRSGGGRRR
jgi:hypothetical protein